MEIGPFVKWHIKWLIFQPAMLVCHNRSILRVNICEQFWKKLMVSKEDFRWVWIDVSFFMFTFITTYNRRTTYITFFDEKKSSTLMKQIDQLLVSWGSQERSTLSTRRFFLMDWEIRDMQKTAQKRFDKTAAKDVCEWVVNVYKYIYRHMIYYVQASMTIISTYEAGSLTAYPTFWVVSLLMIVVSTRWHRFNSSPNWQYIALIYHVYCINIYILPIGGLHATY